MQAILLAKKDYREVPIKFQALTVPNFNIGNIFNWNLLGTSGLFYIIYRYKKVPRRYQHLNLLGTHLPTHNRSYYLLW